MSALLDRMPDIDPSESTLVLGPVSTASATLAPETELDFAPPPRRGLIATMRDEPGLVARIAGEWLAIALMALVLVTFAFLLAFGCYSLLGVGS